MGEHLADKTLKQEQLEIDTPRETLSAQVDAEEFADDDGMDRLLAAEPQWQEPPADSSGECGSDNPDPDD